MAIPEEPHREAAEASANLMPILIPIGIMVMVIVVFGLGFLAIVNSERLDAQKKRADTLQQSVDALKDRAEEDQKFFEIVRQLMIAQSAEDRQVLLDELRSFKFTATPTTSATPATRSSTTTPAPSTTSTTRPSSSPPPTVICINNPVRNICT